MNSVYTCLQATQNEFAVTCNADHWHYLCMEQQRRIAGFPSIDQLGAMGFPPPVAPIFLACFLIRRGACFAHCQPMEEIMTTLTGTKYPKARRGTDRTSYPYQLLKHPKPDNKIGRKVTRGEFKGYRIYSLTLEERATCPASCLRWADCYGNNMPFAHRLKHGLELEARIIGEVFELCHKYPDGVMIRLHVLGDFYSEPYVHIWDMLLGRLPNLAIWGYTHRDPNTDPIGAAILETRERHGNRFAIRQSDNPFCHFSADHESIAGGASITCPEQLGKTDNCGTCALCWSDVPHIRFLHH